MTYHLKNRGDFYILVYKNIGNPETVVQIEAGYDYKVGSDVIVKLIKVSMNFIILKIFQVLLGLVKITKLYLQ